MSLVEGLFADRTLLEGLLGDTFTVGRRERLPDGEGGWVTAYVCMGLVSGRIRPATSEEITVALQEQRRITHVLYTSGDADVARGDRVQGAGLTVDVMGVRNPAQVGHHLEIDCNEVQKETTEVGS